MAVPKKKKEQDLDFQISFYEDLLKKNPDYVDALMALGEIYTKKGLYEKGLKVDRRLIELKPGNPIIHYNLACSLSLCGDIAGALRSLKHAIDLGYDDLVFLNNDPDLSNVRSDERFSDLVTKIKNKKDASNASLGR